MWGAAVEIAMQKPRGTWGMCLLEFKKENNDLSYF